MQVDLSSSDLRLGVSFHKGEWTGTYFCEYAGVVETGDTPQEAFDAAFREHARLCREEDDTKEADGG